MENNIYKRLGYAAAIGALFPISYWLLVSLSQLFEGILSLTVHRPEMTSFPIKFVFFAIGIGLLVELGMKFVKKPWDIFRVSLSFVTAIIAILFVNMVWSGYVFSRLESNFGFLFFKGPVFQSTILLVIGLASGLALFLLKKEDPKLTRIIVPTVFFTVGVYVVLNLSDVSKMARAVFLLGVLLSVPLLGWILSGAQDVFQRLINRSPVFRKLSIVSVAGFILLLVLESGSSAFKVGSKSSSQGRGGGTFVTKARQIENKQLNSLQTCFVSKGKRVFKQKVRPSDVLYFSYTLDPTRAETSAQFTVLVKDKDGKEVSLFRKSLKQDSVEIKSGWINEKIPLKGYSGSDVEVTVSHSAGGLLGGVRLGTFKRGPQEQNVLLLSLDTLRADRLGISGYFRQTSPNIDRIAREGVYFEESISQSPWTLPSHMSVLTGLHPSFHGMLTPLSGELNEDKITLAEKFQQEGYITQAFTGSAAMAANYGFYHGFDRYVEMNGHISSDAEFIFGEGIKWLEQHKNEKFFLFLHTYEIHAPFIHSHFSNDLPPGTSEQEQLDAVYDGGILYTDGYVGKLYDALKKNNLLENTLIVIFSDHGEDLHHRYALEHGHTLYDEIVRVPLIFRHPKLKRRLIPTFQAQHVDIAPTVLDFMGWLDSDKQSQGQSLFSILRGGNVPKKSYAISEGVIYGPDCKSIRMRSDDYGYKYILTPNIPNLQIAFPPQRKDVSENSVFTYQGSPWVMLVRENKGHQFYDLKVDPQERTNIYWTDQRPESDIMDRLSAYLKSVPANITSSSHEMDEDLKEKLQSLGYL